MWFELDTDKLINLDYVNMIEKCENNEGNPCIRFWMTDQEFPFTWKLDNTRLRDNVYIHLKQDLEEFKA